jgi:hypothetical protein
MVAGEVKAGTVVGVMEDVKEGTIVEVGDLKDDVEAGVAGEAKESWVELAGGEGLVAGVTVEAKVGWVDGSEVGKENWPRVVDGLAKSGAAEVGGGVDLAAGVSGRAGEGLGEGFALDGFFLVGLAVGLAATASTKEPPVTGVRLWPLVRTLWNRRV